MNEGIQVNRGRQTNKQTHLLLTATTAEYSFLPYNVEWRVQTLINHAMDGRTKEKIAILLFFFI